jgi:hypothetical protein
MSVAIFSFFGVVIGALLQHFFTRHLDQQRAYRDARTKAYTDYLRYVSEHANLVQFLEPTGVHELSARTADAKCRICLYGSSPTVVAFAEFERLGATMNSAEQRTAFTHMVAIMRKDSADTTGVASGDLQTVLLGAGRDAA